MIHKNNRKQHESLLHCTRVMCDTAEGSECSHLCHLDTYMPLRGLMSVPTAGPWSWGGGGDEGHATSQCVIHKYVCANRMWEDRRRPVGETF